MPSAKRHSKAGITAAGKLFLYITAVVLVLALLIALIASLTNGDRYPKVKDRILPLENKSGETVFLAGDKLLRDKINGSTDTHFYSYDGTKMAISDDEGTLYFVTSKSVTKAAENVFFYVFSEEGDTIAYIDDTNTLYLYRCGSKKTVKIADDVYKSAGAVVSPDGESVLFTKEEDGDRILYVYRKNGKISEVGKDLRAVALSDNGKYIYSYDNGILYLSKAGKETKEMIASGVSFYSILLNKDHTEIIFPSDDKMYIVKSGKEKQRISVAASSLSMALPESTASYYSSVTTYPVAHLLDNVFKSDDGVYYVNGKGEADKIASNASALTLSGDGKTLYYLKESDGLKRVSVKDPSKVTDIADGVKSYAVSADEKTVYYVDEGGDLWSRKGKAAPKKIAGDVRRFAVTEKGLLLFVDEEGTLYSSANSKDTKKVAEGVRGVGAGPRAAYYVSKDGGLYTSNGNAQFKKIADGLL